MKVAAAASGFVLLGGLFSIAQPQQPPPTTKSTTANVGAVVDRYCMGCHSDRVKSGGLSLTAATAKTPEENPDTWEKVVRKLQHRHMPPLGMPRPDERTYEAVIGSLVHSLDTAAAARPDPGHTSTFRRLNRTEYRNAIRDLLAIDVDVSALLPADDTSHGFDNVTVDNLSPTLLERYLTAAQKVSRLAIGTGIQSPRGDTILIPPDLTQEDRLDGQPFGTRGGTVVPYTFPLDAKYEFQLRLARDRNEHVEGLDDVHQLELTIDDQRIGLFTVKPPPRGQDHESVDKDLNARVPVKAGSHVVRVAFLKKTSALIETERQPYESHFNMDRHPRIQPALYSVSIVGPFEATGPGDSQSRKRLFTCYPQTAVEEDACASRVLSKLLRHAYRRPVVDADLKPILQFYKQGRAEEGNFEAGIEMALRAVLVSPHFLFRIENNPAANGTYRLSDTELASRLSFFVWSTNPDDELIDLANRGKLHEAAVLERQVRRMLADTRSESLVTNFAEQWLYLRNLASANPDPRIFPDFDDNLRQAMRRETDLFFQSIVREDRNVLDLLRADYTFLNERLAKHYGIPNVYGTHFRRVNLDRQSMRGGLLTQGSILTVTSYATRTSPVIRGKWILANILAMPPAPPPPQVPPLKDKTVAGKLLTMRERVAQHRANPACASCHNLMDPIGFALENFDAVGRFRTTDGTAPIDASGNLPDGTKFNNAAELQQALLRRPELFVTTLSEKLMTYALGRGIETHDAPAVRAIVRSAAEHDFRFSSIILAIVNSTPFQMRRSS